MTNGVTKKYSVLEYSSIEGDKVPVKELDILYGRFNWLLQQLGIGFTWEHDYDDGQQLVMTSFENHDPEVFNYAIQKCHASIPWLEAARARQLEAIESRRLESKRKRDKELEEAKKNREANKVAKVREMIDQGVEIDGVYYKLVPKE